MNYLPNTKSSAFDAGVLKRSEGYGKQFNPFDRELDNIFFNEWLKGWSSQNLIMIQQ